MYQKNILDFDMPGQKDPKPAPENPAQLQSFLALIDAIAPLRNNIRRQIAKLQDDQIFEQLEAAQSALVKKSKKKKEEK